MGRKKQWITHPCIDGTNLVEISSWKYFNNYICDEMLDYNNYIWRGQKCEDWLLEPTLDRVIKKMQQRQMTRKEIRRIHLENFRYAIRGRRGQNPIQPVDENDWWALGQHYGLITPLLDWTSSPFVAAFFAFSEESNGVSKKRAIYAINPVSIGIKSDEIKSNYQGKGRPPIIEFIKPLSDENSRLVNQSGLFSRAPDLLDIETWVKNNFKGETRYCILIKIILPNYDREFCLRSLNRMNINHVTLFPDLHGASQFCNLNLMIKDY